MIFLLSYDNTYDSMHPMFFAYGPNIKSNNVIEPFDTVDLMNLFCQLLDIDPPSYVQGKRENILGILKDESEIQKISRTAVMSKIKFHFYSYFNWFKLHFKITNFIKIF